MIQDVPIATGTRWGGQYLSNAAVDVNGYLAGVAGTPVAVLSPFYGVAQGDGLDQRTGDYITMKSLTYKINFVAATLEVNRIGCYIVLDSQPNNPTPPSLMGLPAGPLVATDTFLDNDTPASGIAPTMFQNLDTCSGPKPRFKLVKHISVRVGKTTAGSAVGPLKPSVIVSGTLKMPYKLRYDGAGLLPQNQNLLFMFYSDSGAVLHPTFDLRCRFRFKDA